jgi:hypothetical protein
MAVKSFESSALFGDGEGAFALGEGAHHVLPVLMQNGRNTQCANHGRMVAAEGLFDNGHLLLDSAVRPYRNHRC